MYENRIYFDFSVPSPDWSYLRHEIINQDTGISTEGRFDWEDIVHCDSIDKIPPNWKEHTAKVLENLGIKQDSDGRYYK